MTELEVARLGDDLADLVDKHKLPFLITMVKDGVDIALFSYALTDEGLICLNVLRPWLEENIPTMKDKVKEALQSNDRAFLSNPDNRADFGRTSQMTVPSPSPEPG